MATFAEIEAALEEAACRDVLWWLANPDPHENDLPIRHHRTGQIVAYLPERERYGAKPVIRDGLVVGYYRDTPEGRQSVSFRGKGEFLGWCQTAPGELWMVVFNNDDDAVGGFRVGVEGGE